MLKKIFNMQYKLIKIKNNKEYLCDKVTVDGFDYYVSDKKPIENDWCIKEQQYFGKSLNKAIGYSDLNSTTAIWKKVIATTNPNIDIPQVVDEVKVLNLAELNSEKHYYAFGQQSEFYQLGFVEGYNESQKTHPNFDEDEIEFIKQCAKNKYFFDTEIGWCQHRVTKDGDLSIPIDETEKELLQLWKKQKPKIIYYNG